MKAFLDVLDGAPLPITWDDVRSTYQLCILADKSQRQKRMIRVADEIDTV